VGVIHSAEEKLKIEVPKPLEYLWEGADADRVLPLEGFHQQITEALVSYGRVGVQVTASESGGEPYLALWGALSIVNWDRDFVVLDSSRYVRNGFQWDWETLHRVVERLPDGSITSTLYRGDDLIHTTVIRGLNGAPTRFPLIVASAVKV